jgi:CheY-like chemotaxis protein
MDGTVLGIWSQAAAVAAFGTIGGMLVRSRDERPGTATIGVGLLVGALLQAVDTMADTTHVRTSMPLAAMAIAITAFLAHAGTGANPSQGLAGVLARSGLRMATFGAVLMVLLHWLHGVMPHQIHIHFGLTTPDVGVVDAPLVVLLTWLALRASGVPGDVRFLLLCTALSRLAALQFAPHGASVAAGAQVLGAAPMLLRRLAADAPTLAVATATSAAFAFTCLLRTQAQLQGSTPRLAGIDDPLLVLGAVVVLFGAALMRAYGREAASTHHAAPTNHLANTTEDTMAVSVAQPASPSPNGSMPPTTRLPAVASTEVASPTVQHDAQTTRAEPAEVAPASSLTARDVVRDLRSPITSMVAAIGLLSPAAGQEERRRQLSTLQEYGRQLSTALTDLDDFEVLLRGTIDLAEDAFDLGQLLQACVDEVAPTLTDRGLRICLDASPSLPRWVQGDPSRVRQLVTRMLHLATQHATVGSVDVSAAASDGQLHVSVLHRDCTLPDDARSLGLMFCSQLALVLGGELSLQPAGDNGFQLHLKLPHRAAPAWEVELLEEDGERAAPPDQPSAAPAAQVRGRVLLVEDSPDHQLLIGRLLDRAGAQVTMANSGEVALHLSEQQSFDLILLDMQMPGIDGYQTVRTWRERGLLTPVLALTADTTAEDVEHCLAAGCNGHLAKPVAPTLLQRSLAMHLPAATTS